jgi:hypothetical protein
MRILKRHGASPVGSAYWSHSLSDCSSAEAAARCHARRDALVDWCGLLSRSGFDWVKPPVLNPYTRLAVTISPARAILRVAGYEMIDSDGPKQVVNRHGIRIPWRCTSKSYQQKAYALRATANDEAGLAALWLAIDEARRAISDQRNELEAKRLLATDASFARSPAPKSNS